MMLSKRWQGLFIMALAFTFSMGFASTAFAQDATTGLARVRAVDPDGAPLPGVMVVVSGPVGQQTSTPGSVVRLASRGCIRAEATPPHSQWTVSQP